MAAQEVHLTPFHWHLPVAVRFGTGGPEALAAAARSERVLLLTYAGASNHEAPRRLHRALGEQGLVIEVPDGLSSVSAARALASRIWPELQAHPPTVLVGVGGGSVLDLAKLLRCRPHGNDFDSLLPALRGTGPWPALAPARLWLVPTTAGTGSEVTRWATIWDTDATPARKLSFDEPFGFAERAFVDAAFTLTCPAAVRRDSALDALSHALEAIWNRHANPLSDTLAVDAARRVLALLPRALSNPRDGEACEGLSLAALEAGLAFAQTRTALAHALSYALTLDTGTPHGLACAVWLPTAWRLAAGRDARVDDLLTRVFDAPASEGAERLLGWLRSIGIDAHPQSHGVSDPEARILDALASPRGRNFIAAAG